MPEPREVVQEAVELAQFGVAELNIEGRFVSMDATYLSMLGIQEADLLGQHWHSTVHSEDYGRVEEAYRMARTTGRGYAEILGLRSDSMVVYQALLVTGVCDDSGVFSGYHCLRHDISRYKRAQEALVLAVESAPNGLLMLNSAGLIQSANRAVESLFGYQREELIGRKVEMLLPERYRARHLGHRDNFNSNKDMKAMAGRDLVGLRTDGVEIPLQLYLNRISTHTGELILCTIIDIAERVRYQQQLELAKHAAEAANHAKSDFLARMSHEIRTPMNLIMGMNSLLLESPLSDKQRQHVEISHRNVRRLLRLINGILDLSKVEAGMLTLVSLPFDLNEVIHECAASMSSAIESKGVQFEISIDPDVWLYWIGDSERVQQVLMNLIGNSVKFTARGKIEVRVRSENSAEGERGLRFEVTDTGCGVPADKTGLIFEAFQQAEGAMNRPYEGTGLGLSIAKTLVEMMSGKIWLEQTGESGSKFVFTAFFPVARKEDVRARAGMATAAGEGQTVEPGTRILLAEDNPENVILLRAYLDNRSLSLHFASNGVEAFKKRQQFKYDLVLMDIQMPIMDGYTATREIREWERVHDMPRIPIVALTAHALSGAFAESTEAGCDGHLTKPVDRDDLLEAIAKFAKHPPKPVAPVLDPIAARRPAFLENRALDLIKMRDALGARDFATIQRIGHNAKGIGTGYGFPEISTAGANVECAARALDLIAIEKSIREFESCVHAASPVQDKALASQESAGGCPMRG
jgi:two-component system, sensor histidine kinase